MVKLILVSLGVFIGVMYSITIITLTVWKKDIPTDGVILAALGWAIFTLGLFWG